MPVAARAYGKSGADAGIAPQAAVSSSKDMPIPRRAARRIAHAEARLLDVCLICEPNAGRWPAGVDLPLPRDCAPTWRRHSFERPEP